MRCSGTVGARSGSLSVDRWPDSDLFAWPAVVEDRNVVGPEWVLRSPGLVAGLGLALAQFGTMEWGRLLTQRLNWRRAVCRWTGTLL
ncbi:MAG: hypothetical protein CM1200mP41_15920 [Gammaproteobacteria bacterium]|nr:MAG: hypothetical protein CM1200mP41_15920 [Gammaproteobacteria bacterium]